MQFTDIVAKRQSVKAYDPSHEISNPELKAIFEQVRLSPSSFNMQNWHFVVVRDKANKQAMRKAAWDQAQVEEASAAVLVVGRLDGVERMPEIWADAPAQIRDLFVPMSREFYKDKPQLVRDEAVRSASLAAMTLMYTAVDRGYAVCPMIGFDPVAVAQIAGLGEQDIPVMIVVIGKQKGEVRPRGHRYPVEQFVTCETRSGPGLQ